MFSSRSNVFHLNSVKFEETKRVIQLPFEYIRENENDFGTVMIHGEKLFVFKDVHETLTPSTFENGRLALKDSNLKTREYFTFPTMLDVRNAVEEVVLEDNRLVVTINDVAYKRKLKVSVFAPDWLVEKYN
ncbi:hypothetical protein P4493_04365 [Bacillus thuringiensis]|jgi:hypothetical protein|uniref:Uncharacterized protein n=4 Tax=Bacillus thuringiensis TaxID=1428 RepID=A0A0B5NKX4_BACTU|nr:MULTISPECIES: hypothetical protein [Bacillus]MEC2534474.1 hypothetical protein [Bacillus cereus]MED1153775.1 hypothetical protein [Bacillus paranthracis]OUB09363.1 hypothetical protein BK708_33100 [Bacillus thuringiensis serovar yunnanensis]AFQ30087.1 hypothetical protein BTF1_29932 [Bacillus thuringiensis HD-789]AJG74037.1 hypothetical protein BF38_5889 [Bacillus thuringiensis]